MKTPITLLLVLLTLAAAQVVYYAPRLPEQLASHFGTHGEPNGWQSLTTFLQFYAAILGVMLVVFLVMPRGLHRLPDAWFNLPHKDVWLSDTHREQTLHDLQQRIAYGGVITLAFLMALFQLVFDLNLSSQPRLPAKPFWALMIAYLALLFAWSFLFWRAYRKPTAPHTTA